MNVLPAFSAAFWAGRMNEKYGLDAMSESEGDGLIALVRVAIQGRERGGDVPRGLVRWALGAGG